MKNDFVLIKNCATFCSSNFATQLAHFKSRKRQNKNSILTILYTSKKSEYCPVVGYQTNTYKLVHYNSQRDEKIKIGKSAFILGTTFRTDIIPCGVASCAHDFVSHFSGNYDLQTFDSIIHDVLCNEEFLLQQIHIELVDDMASYVASDYTSLMQAHKMLINRDFFPLTFDNVFPLFSDFSRLEYYKESNIYAPSGKEYSINVRDSVFGKNCLIHETASINFSSFGLKARVGKLTKIANSIFGENILIGDNCSIEDSIIGANVTLGENVRVSKQSIIGNDVSIPAHTTIESGTVIQKSKPLESFEKGSDGENIWSISCDAIDDNFVWHLIRNKKHELFWDSCVTTSCKSSAKHQLNDSFCDDDEEKETGEITDVTYQGNNEIFLSEVMETLNAVLESNEDLNLEKIEKLKLEINASKLAYNISMDDLSKSIFYAFISLPAVHESFAKFSNIFVDLRDLWKNYYRRNINKMHLLHAIEDFSTDNEKFRRMVPKILHFLYDTEEFLEEEVLLDWYQNLPVSSPLTLQLKQLIEWVAKDENDDSDSD